MEVDGRKYEDTSCNNIIPDDRMCLFYTYTPKKAESINNYYYSHY